MRTFRSKCTAAKLVTLLRTGAVLKCTVGSTGYGKAKKRLKKNRMQKAYHLIFHNENDDWDIPKLFKIFNFQPIIFLNFCDKTKSNFVSRTL